MKRRTFLQGLGAAGLVTPSLGHFVTESLSDEVAQQRPGVYRALITADSGHQANEIWTAMGRPADIMVVGPGAAICGMSTEMLLLAHEDGTTFWGRQHAELNQRWINEALRTRLTPGAGEVAVHFTETEFDWGMQCGVAASFMNLVDATYRRQAWRNHMPLADLTYDSRIQARARLLQWYVNSPPPLDREYS